MDRYNHDIGDDTDDTDDSPLFGSFSSYSPQSRKISQSRPQQTNIEPEVDSKKQPFHTELESTVSQLSLVSNTSVTTTTTPSKLLETSQNSEKGRSLLSVKTTPCVENLSRPIKSSISSIGSTSTGSSESQLTVVKNIQSENTSINLSTPDSSQTESEDISPQIQRKRHTHSRDKLPRFSIPIDDEHM